MNLKLADRFAALIGKRARFTGEVGRPPSPARFQRGLLEASESWGIRCLSKQKMQRLFLLLPISTSPPPPGNPRPTEAAILNTVQLLTQQANPAGKVGEGQAAKGMVHAAKEKGIILPRCTTSIYL